MVGITRFRAVLKSAFGIKRYSLLVSVGIIGKSEGLIVLISEVVVSVSMVIMFCFSLIVTTSSKIVSRFVALIINDPFLASSRILEIIGRFIFFPQNLSTVFIASFNSDRKQVITMI